MQLRLGIPLLTKMLPLILEVIFLFFVTVDNSCARGQHGGGGGHSVSHSQGYSAGHSQLSHGFSGGTSTELC